MFQHCLFQKSRYPNTYLKIYSLKNTILSRTVRVSPGLAPQLTQRLGTILHCVKETNVPSLSHLSSQQHFLGKEGDRNRQTDRQGWPATLLCYMLGNSPCSHKPSVSWRRQTAHRNCRWPRGLLPWSVGCDDIFGCSPRLLPAYQGPWMKGKVPVSSC